ncbi:MAG: hypothetical protein ACOYL6_16635 [Bacteriovoracaceae bacterium]
MNCCQIELEELIQVYEARIGKTENYLVELDFKGNSSSLNYKICFLAKRLQYAYGGRLRA